MRSPLVGVLVGVVVAEDRGDVEALLLHSPKYKHTVRLTTVGVMSLVAGEASLVARESVHDGVGGDGRRGSSGEL